MGVTRIGKRRISQKFTQTGDPFDPFAGGVLVGPHTKIHAAETRWKTEVLDVYTRDRSQFLACSPVL